MNNAVASGSYADMKIVKTRSVMQVVIEIDIEQADRFLEMFGVPKPGAEIPVAIARLNEGAERGNADGRSPQPVAEVSEKPRRKFEDMSPSQQAGMLCAEPSFREWLMAKNPDLWDLSIDSAHSLTDRAAGCVRRICRVISRSNLNTDDRASQAWAVLVAEYREWQTTNRYEDVRR